MGIASILNRERSEDEPQLRPEENYRGDKEGRGFRLILRHFTRRQSI